MIYLGSAPKSNRAYVAFQKAMKDVEASPYEPVPLQIRNAVTKLMKEIGYGQDYAYAHDFELGTTDMETLPDRLKGRTYYEPGAAGFEKDIRKRMEWWVSVKARIRADGKKGGGA